MKEHDSMHWLSCLALCVPAPSSSPATPQDTPGPGYVLSALPYPGATAFAASTTLSSGEVVVFDGTTVALFAPDGTLLAQLGSLGSFAFPSFVLADPGETFLVFGESSNGDIYSVSLGGSVPDLVATLPFNYDAAMRDSTDAYVSAATCGLGCGNEIWRVRIATHETSLVARVGGASGPLVFDGAGNLYYGTATALFPPPPKPSSILRWTAAQLASPLPLDRSDAQFIGGGFAGAARLAYDLEQDVLFLMENNYATGENRVRRVLGSADDSPVLVEGRPFLSMGNLAFHPGEDAAAFLPHQPASGGSLTYTTTDFGTLVERLELRPSRPSASLSGDGTGGPGVFTLLLESGPPLGFARVFFCPQPLYHATERVFPVAGLPLFWGLDLPSQGSVPGLLSLDGQGRLLQDYVNPGGFEGQFALQLLLLDASARLAATSAAAFL